MQAHRSLTGLLTAVYLLLLVYASLYPFEGWNWPAGLSALELLSLPWPPWRHPFDEWANLMGYLPFGAMLFAMVVRNDGSVWWALLVAVCASALLSYGLEVLQNFVPRRFPSLRDWLHNVLGATVGASLAWLAFASGWLERWHRVQERWFVQHSSAAVVLLMLWPIGLLFPTPVPLGMGQVWPEIRLLILAAVVNTPLELDIKTLLESNAWTQRSLPTLSEGLAIALGLLSPCLLAHVVTRAGWRRWFLAPGAALLAIATMTLSTALNFGPEHAWTWMTHASTRAIAAATLAGMALTWAGPRICAALALVAITAMVFIVADAPADPYYAASLQGWEQGRFIRFHGLAQWIGQLWPYAAMAWLLARLARRT
jgi:VanZ family protein